MMMLNRNIAPSRPKSYVNVSYWESLHALRNGDLSAVGYPELGEGFNRSTYRMRLQALERLLRRGHAWPIERLLEGGVGIGAYAPLWQRAGVGSWTGLDISGTAIERLRQTYPAQQFYVADLGDKAGMDSVLKDSRFPLVTAIDVLYHIVNDNAFGDALGSLALRVQPGGYLVVSDIFGSRDCLTAAHVKRRAITSYERILDPLGFRLSDLEPVVALLGDCGPHSPRSVGNLLLRSGWRVAAKCIRVTPARARDLVGTLVAEILKPLDAALRASGMSKGVNLELALFRRAL